MASDSFQVFSSAKSKINLAARTEDPVNISYVDWLRKQVGTHKVFLPFSSIILRDEQSRILLQQRTDFDFWGLPGGVLELDEDLESCAPRPASRRFAQVRQPGDRCRSLDAGRGNRS